MATGHPFGIDRILFEEIDNITHEVVEDGRKYQIDCITATDFTPIVKAQKERTYEQEDRVLEFNARPELLRGMNMKIDQAFFDLEGLAFLSGGSYYEYGEVIGKNAFRGYGTTNVSYSWSTPIVETVDCHYKIANNTTAVQGVRYATDKIHNANLAGLPNLDIFGQATADAKSMLDVLETEYDPNDSSKTIVYSMQTRGNTINGQPISEATVLSYDPAGANYYGSAYPTGAMLSTCRADSAEPLRSVAGVTYRLKTWITAGMDCVRNASSYQYIPSFRTDINESEVNNMKILINAGIKCFIVTDYDWIQRFRNNEGDYSTFFRAIIAASETNDKIMRVPNTFADGTQFNGYNGGLPSTVARLFTGEYGSVSINYDRYPKVIYSLANPAIELDITPPNIGDQIEWLCIFGVDIAEYKATSDRLNIKFANITDQQSATTDVLLSPAFYQYMPTVNFGTGTAEDIYLSTYPTAAEYTEDAQKAASVTGGETNVDASYVSQMALYDRQRTLFKTTIWTSTYAGEDRESQIKMIFPICWSDYAPYKLTWKGFQNKIINVYARDDYRNIRSSTTIQKLTRPEF